MALTKLPRVLREPREHDIVHIEGAELLPLSRNPEWIESIPHDTEVVFFCHHGGRSHAQLRDCGHGPAQQP